MYLEITYEQALARHPELVAKVMAQLAKGKSKERGSAPESLTWGYYWAVTIQSFTLGQLLSGKGPPVDTRTLEERTTCGLWGGKGRWYGVAWRIRPVPREVMNNINAWSGDQ